MTPRPEAAPLAAATAASQAPGSAEQPRATPAQEGPATAPAAITDPASDVEPVRQAAPAQAEEVEARVPADDGDGIPGETVAGILAALGLGAAGYAAMRSRRRRRSDALDDPPAEPQIGHTAPVPTTATAAAARPAMAAPFGSRAELLDRMVAAEPDAANPFTSGKARRRRARLILQQRDAQIERDTAQFDWRTYRPQNANTPAVPPLVTA
ncbi:hypothetical protein [Novosphingobium sp. M1R2S20]|uniref:Uncharacterized protein n=1 Tax=Novosphingobium rhizovicinum TaxID=3228928 RepID=A0ABV3RB25_9SPHN